MTVVRKSRSPRNSQLAEGVGKKRFLIRSIWAKGVTERMVEWRHRGSTSSDASGEAGSE